MTRLTLFLISLLLIPSPAGAATVNTSWMQVECKGADCMFHVPNGFRRFTMHYHHGGDYLGTERTFNTEPRRYGAQPSFKRRINDAVRVDCASRGNAVECSIYYTYWVTDFETTFYSGHDDMGGMIGTGFTV